MRQSKTMLLVIGLGVVGVMTLLTWAVEENKEKVSIDQLPAAVKATILMEAKGGTIKGIERELEEGKIVYEAEVVIDGKEFDIEVAADGTLLEDEAEDEDDEEDVEEIPIDQVPAAARRALMQHAGKHEIAKAERERENGTTFYEAEWTVNGRKHEAKVTAEGALVELEEIVDPRDIPAAVKAVAAKKFPAGAEVEYEKKMIVVYELEGEIDGKDVEVLVTPTGEVYEDDED